MSIFNAFYSLPNWIFPKGPGVVPGLVGDAKNSFPAVHEQKEAEFRVLLRHQRSVCNVYSKSYICICLQTILRNCKI